VSLREEIIKECEKKIYQPTDHSGEEEVPIFLEEVVDVVLACVEEEVNKRKKEKKGVGE